MICGLPPSDDELPEFLPLPCNSEEHWQSVAAALDEESAIESLDELEKRMSSYGGAADGIGGLKAALRGGAMDTFLMKTLPYIIGQALALPAESEKLAAASGPLRFLRQNHRCRLKVPRQLGVSLLANMFLGTFDTTYKRMRGNEAMPSPSFSRLFGVPARNSPEVSKLQMFLHFFRRLSCVSSVPGELVIDRMVGASLSEDVWLASGQLLLPMELARPRVGFEKTAGRAHADADFANMFIGGGVVTGGCVQEEIRFSICPELCVSMLLCPCMLPDEAIQIVGAEQFSSYRGYASSLRFDGDHVDMAERTPEGVVQVAVLAMDAIDFRATDASLKKQMLPRTLLRDLNKSLAAFTPADLESLESFPEVATGNWGCGAFGGCAPLKALIQWASASQCGRRLHYFPFEEQFGPELQRLTSWAAAAGVTVGQLLQVLWQIGDELTCCIKKDCDIRRKRNSRYCSICADDEELEEDKEHADVEEKTMLREVRRRLELNLSRGEA